MSAEILKGFYEIGYMVGSVKTKLGEPDQNGVSINIAPNTINIEFAASDFPADILPTSTAATFSGTLHNAELTAMLNVFNLPSDALASGVLSIQPLTLGTGDAREWYITGPGPAGGTRTYNILRGKIRLTGPFVVGREENVKLAFEITALATGTGTDSLFTITDEA